MLCRAFSDAECRRVISEIHCDPHAAILKYSHAPGMREFLTQFIELMGEHLASLSRPEETRRDLLRPDVPAQEIVAGLERGGAGPLGARLAAGASTDEHADDTAVTASLDSRAAADADTAGAARPKHDAQMASAMAKHRVRALTPTLTPTLTLATASPSRPRPSSPAGAIHSF